MTWSFWLDRGGTFTDVVGCCSDGRWEVRKVLSVAPASETPAGSAQHAGHRVDPAVAAIAEVLGVAGDQPIPAGQLQEIRLGTTVATNALLEHKGAPVLLFANRGLGDLCWIGDQHRPDLFALKIERPQPLAIRVLEVGGRLAVDGQEVEPLLLDALLEQQVRQALADGYCSGAIALMHSTREPRHELELARWLRQRGLDRLVLSHQVSAQPRLVPRIQTSLIEAAVAPVLFGYLSSVQQALGPQTPLRVIGSSGALAAVPVLQAKDTILSGPTGGMVGAVRAARQVIETLGWGDRPVLGVDMGGTSTDVFFVESALDPVWERRPETEILGLRLQAPMLPIHTVAAGGGSVVSFDGQSLQVGPLSAGADPGPACYGRGGPATITDANLVLGRLPVGALPKVFGVSGDQPADRKAATAVFADLAKAMAAVAPGITPEQVAEGALAIAIETMVQAVKRITIQRGHALQGAVLVSYGGAGGQHACRLAEILGLEHVVVHPLAGVLSAYGIGMAEQRLLLEQVVRQPLEPAQLPALVALRHALTKAGRQRLQKAGDLDPGQRLERQVRLEVRFVGRDQGLELSWPELPGSGDLLAAELDRESAGEFDGELVGERAGELDGELDGLVDGWREGFARSHQRRYGYLPESTQLVVERLQVELVARSDLDAVRGGGSPAMATPGPNLPGPLAPGEQAEGPALLVSQTTTTVVDPGWRAQGLADGALVLQFVGAAAQPGDPPLPALEVAGGPDPVLLELFNHRFMAIAEQMGERLQQSARSVNIRERLDFSCALFDGAGQLVANAPHIPVHLGSMGESVVALLEAVRSGERPPLVPGDVVITNNPYRGGTHLPDITAITPVFADEVGDGARGMAAPSAFVACRGHHGDVGGITPGSMPALSRTIADEGLLLENERFLSQGQLDQGGWLQRFQQGPWPVRNPSQLLADLQAQVAANRYGAEALQQLFGQHGLGQVLAYMAHGQAHGAACVRRVIAKLHDGHHRLELDQGAVIAVQVTINRQTCQARLDFSGTSPQQPTNFNAPLAVTKAVVLYVFRCLVGEQIPLNAGCFDPLELVVPEGCLLNPGPPAAVVAGNVEVAQATANALFAALGVQAAAQGTMNNVSFGNDTCQYYETICGGTGAGLDRDGRGYAGAAAVQSHMTNSRLTDPEILEERYPVRLETFAFRRNSGGAGQWRGGDGVVRQLRFLAPMQAVVLSGSRRIPPFGLAGGEPGACGRNLLLKPHGRDQRLPGTVQLGIEAGEALRLETPGGGGYGKPAPEPAQVQAPDPIADPGP